MEVYVKLFIFIALFILTMIQEENQFQNSEDLSSEKEQSSSLNSPFVRTILPYGETGHIGEMVFGNEGDIEMKESSVIENAQKYIQSYRKESESLLQGVYGYTFIIIPFEKGVLLRMDFVEATDAKIQVVHNISNLKNAVEYSQMPAPSGNLKEAFDMAVQNNLLPNNEGSSIYINGDQKFIIKGLDEKFWSAASAKQDYDLIFKSVTSHLEKEAKKIKKNGNNWFGRFFKK